jgi:hypothetical protein
VKQLAEREVLSLASAADNAISEGDYEAHPEYHVVFSRAAKPRLVRDVCQQWYWLRQEVKRLGGDPDKIPSCGA